MFEAILEKILVNNVGPYINGIDKKNLKVGIWSGDVVISNISIKSEIIKMLGLPFVMKYSFVGKLTLKVSWKSIASRPVELNIEDVFIILQPLDQEKWTVQDDSELFAKRMEIVESLMQNFTQKILEKAKDGQKAAEEQGMVGKLTEKVIDNLQLSLKNIHLRFESPSSKPQYAWGITLDEITVFTTNSNWEKQFVDRTEPQNKLLPLNKLLTMKNLGLYWVSGTKQLYGDLDSQKTLKFMRDYILKDPPSDNKASANVTKKADYIITLSAHCKLLQKNKKSPWVAEKPEFDVGLELEPLNIQLKKPQVQDLVKLLEFIANFEQAKEVHIRSKQYEIDHISSEDRKRYDETIKDMLAKILKHPQREELKGDEKLQACLENPNDVETFKKLLLSVPEEDISMISKQVVKDAERDKQMKIFDEKKQEKGWFSWGKGDDEKDLKKKEEKLKEATRLRNEHLAKVERSLTETLGDDNGETQVEVEEARNILALDFVLNSCETYLSDIGPAKNEEVTYFSFSGLAVKVNLTSKSKRVELSVKNFGMEERTKYFGYNKFVQNDIVRRIHDPTSPDHDKNILTFKLNVNPVGLEEGTYLFLDLKTIEILFKTMVVKRLTNFFTVKTDDELLRAKVSQQIEKAQDKANEAATVIAKDPAKKFINVNLAAPVIVIPFNQDGQGDSKKDCWVLSLGNFKVDTKDANKSYVDKNKKVSKKALTRDQERMYESFIFDLSGAKFQYFPSQSLYLKSRNSQADNKNAIAVREQDIEDGRQVVDVLGEFNIRVDLDKVRPEFEGDPLIANQPQLKVNAEIPTVRVTLKPKLYSDLLNIGDLMKDSMEDFADMIEESRKKLLQYNPKVGNLSLVDGKKTKYNCIFNKRKLFLFEEDSDTPKFSYHIRGEKTSVQGGPELPCSFIVK